MITEPGGPPRAKNTSHLGTDTVDAVIIKMGPGESFGEIALLRRIPRTATVIAISRVEVRTLGREEFLAAVTGDPESAESAEEVVSTRLQAG